MKRLLLTIALTVAVIFVKSQQDFKLKLVATDSHGNKDSIYFGMNENATLGIDSSLNEEDMYNTPFDSLDFRVIQRDSMHWHCLNGMNWVSDENIYSIYNIDLKTDLRPFIFGYFFDTICNNFEIIVKAINYPIVITCLLYTSPSPRD